MTLNGIPRVSQDMLDELREAGTTNPSMTPKAEALREALEQRHVEIPYSEDVVIELLRTLVEELEITEEDAVILAELGYDGYLILLELAGTYSDLN